MPTEPVPHLQQDRSRVTDHPLYAVWAAMKARCYNSHTMYYARYGGRGIIVCPEWHDYKRFETWGLANGYEHGLTIDRIDNDGPYSPDNCHWATYTLNAENRSNAVRVTAWGETKNISVWARDPRCNVREATIRQRIRKGWDPEVAITASPNSQPRPPRSIPLPPYCLNGHPQNSTTVKYDSRGGRVCIPCARERSRAYKQRRKEIA